ncbi:MAG: GrpB family protein, partial [bacterium]
TLFATEVARLQDVLLARGIVLALEHVGSTAVSGLDAKPVLDILAGCASGSDRGEIIVALETAGYRHRGEQGIPGRNFFRRGEPRQYHLHVAEESGTFWRDHLAFRDYLRTHDDARAAYSALKHELATRYPTNRASYIDGKTAFVEQILLRATGTT